MIFNPQNVEGSKPSPTIDLRSARSLNIEEVRLKLKELVHEEVLEEMAL